MSQASNPAIVKSSSSQVAPAANATISRETLLNYLIQASKTMRRVELGVGIAGWLCVVVVVLLLAILIDHWLWPLNMFARFAVFGSLAAWTLWWVPRRILPLLFRPIHPEHAARKIESQYPEIKESLISWLQLSTNSENAAPKGVLAVIGRFAVRNLGGQDSSNIIDSANLIRLAALLFGFLLTGSVYLFVAPKSGVTSLTRMLMPWANISPAARVRIVSVAPGNATITQGTNLPLAVTLRGMHKGDSVFVRYDLSDGQRVGQRLKLNEELEGINYKLDFGKSFGGIHQPLQYWIEAGDATEGPFDLRVQVVPIVAIDRLDFEFPAYTKLKPKSIQKDGLIEAPEGTWVNLYAHANQPMAKSKLEFNPVINNGVFHSASETLDLQTSETQLKGKWLLNLDKKKSNPTVGTYRIKATNSLGESNGDPVIYKMKVIGDLPPKVSLQSDLPSIIELSVHDSLEIEMRASDPDYGLVSLAATGKLDSDNTIKEKKTVFESSVFESSNGTTGQIVRVFTFSPKEHNLQVGDRIEFRAIGRDNRCQPGTDVPEPNQSSSTPILIRIVDGPKDTKNSEEDKEQQKPDSSDDKKQTANSKSKPEDKKGKNQNNSKSSPSDNKPQDQKTKEGPSNQKSNDKPGEPENEDSDPQEPNSQEQDKNQDKNSQSKKDGQSSNGKSDKQDKNKDDKKSSKDKEGGSGGGSSDVGEGDSQGSGSQSNNGNSKKNSKSSSSKGNQSTNDASNTEGTDSEPGESEDSNSAGQTSRTQSRLKNSSKQNANKADPAADNDESSNPDKDPEPPEHDGETFERLLDEMQRNKGNDKDSQEPQDGKQSDGKQSDGKQSDGKQSDGKQSDGKQSDGKQSDGKQSDGKQSDGKQSDGKQSDGKQSDGKQSDGKQSDGKQSDGKQSDGKQSDGKQSDGKQSDGKQSDGKQSDGKQSDGKQSDGKQSDGKQSDGKQSDGKQSDGKQSDGKQSDGKQSDGKQSDGKQSDGKQSDGKQSDGKQSDGKQSDGKQSDGKQSDGKQSDGKQSDGKQSDGKQSDGKQSDGMQSDGKQSDGKQSDGKQSDGKQSDGKQSDGKQSDGKQSDGKQSDGKQSDGKQSDGKQSDGKQSDGKQSDGKQSDGKKSDGKQSDGKQSDGKKSDGKQSDGKQSDGKQSDGKQSDGKQSDGKQADGKQADGKQAEQQKPGEGSGESEGEGGKSGSKSSKPSANSSGGEASGGKETENVGAGGSNKRTGDSPDGQAEDAKQDYADKTTDLALDYLKKQKDQPDPELLKRMNWTKEDMQKFLQRWTEAKEQAKSDPNKKRELDATLRSLGLRPSKSRERKVEDQDDALKGLLEEGNRVRPPETLREKWEQYRKASGNL